MHITLQLQTWDYEGQRHVDAGVVQIDDQDIPNDMKEAVVEKFKEQLDDETLQIGMRTSP